MSAKRNTVNADLPFALQEPLLASAGKGIHGRPGWLFHWVRSPLERRSLSLCDLWLVPPGPDVPWANKELHRYLQAHPRSTLSSALFACFWRPMLPAVMCKLAADALRYVPALLLSELLEILAAQDDAREAPREPLVSPVAWAMPVASKASEAVLLAALLPVVTLLQAVLVNQYFWHALRLGALVRGALAAAVCRQSLRYSLWESVDSGFFCNLLSSDGARVSNLCGSVNMLWSAPLQLSIALAMLWRALGPPALGGLAVMLALLPVQALLSQRLGQMRARTAAATDVRLRRTEAAFASRQAIKLMRWEALCAGEVAAARASELAALKGEARVKALSVLLATVAPTAVSLATFMVLALSGQRLYAPAVFSALALFNAMRAPLTALPEFFSSLAHARVALQRFAAVLAEKAPGSPCDPLHIHPSTATDHAGFPNTTCLEPLAVVATMTSASFTWHKGSGETHIPFSPLADATRRSCDSAASLSPYVAAPDSNANCPEAVPAALHNLTMQVQRGQLLVVLGGTGAGKSTLLAALLGELRCVGGVVGLLPGLRIAYCGQNVYLTRGSLRENVLFGRRFDAQRYQLCLEACALQADIAAWPRGDSTGVGDKGVEISGGQQARVALARAVYGEADLCLLDDTLASLDPQVCTHVWHQALRGALHASAVVLSTSSAQLAILADSVILLEDGKIVQQGSPAALATAPGPFAELLAGGLQSDAPHALCRVAAEAHSEVASNHELPPAGCRNVQGTPACAKASRLLSRGQGPKAEHEPHAALKLPEIPLPLEAVHELHAAWKSGKAKGTRVDGDVYRHYALAFGRRGCGFGAAVAMFFASQASMVLVDCWLAHWSSLTPAQQEDLATNLGVFAALAALAAVLVSVQAYTWPVLCLRASSQMHCLALSHVLRAPLGLSLASSSGQLLARFSKDLDCLDSSLPTMLSQALACIAALLSALATMVIKSPLALPVVVLVAVAFLYVVRTYRPLAAESARLTSVLHGPLVAHLVDCIRGREYVRAYAQQGRAAAHALALIEAGARAQIFNVALQRWFALQLEVLGAVTLLCVALLCVAVQGSAHLGLSGLSLTYALTLTALAKYLVNYATRADAQFVSVERLHVLATLQPEEETSTDSAAGLGPAAHWPEKGHLVLRDYCPAAYLSNNQVILQPLTLAVYPGEHVALVGRSGAGKSTLLAGLSRLLPVASGTLVLDGWDATKVKLSRWREALQCIPQKPLLLAGTVAHNLDPHSHFSEKSLWEVLRFTGLQDFIHELPGQLETQVQGLEGERLQLSVGQRQLLVLARLLLRRAASRLVLLDEPAAGLEQQEGARLHEALREQLPPAAAAITVTHRLLPALHHFSRVIVLAGGCCVEDGTPTELLQSSGGHLHELFEQAPPRLQAQVKDMLAFQSESGPPAMRSHLRSTL